MRASDIPVKFVMPFGASSAPGDITYPVPPTSQSGIDPLAASLPDGFPPATFAAPNAPYGKDFQGVLKQSTAWDWWYSAGAPVSYDATFQSAIGGYPQGAVVASLELGNFWFSLVDNNTSDPETGGANWVAFTPLPTYAADSGTANAVAIALPQTIASLASLAGQLFTVKKIASANTTATTMSVNTFSGNLVHPDASALGNGDLPASCTFTALCDGTKFLLQSPTGTAAFKSVTDTTQAKVPSMKGSATVGHVATFADTSGTIQDGGAPLRANSTGFVNFTNGSTPSFVVGGGITNLFSAEAFLLCKSGELGYATNSLVPIVQAGDNNRGINIEYNPGTGTMTVIIATGGIQLFDNTGSLSTITPSNWQIGISFVWN